MRIFSYKIINELRMCNLLESVNTPEQLEGMFSQMFKLPINFQVHEYMAS